MLRKRVSQAFMLVVLCIGVVLAQTESFEDSTLQTNASMSLTPNSLHPRQLTEGRRCTKDKPCSDGSCCNGATGFCGRSAEYCSAKVCSSNCDARADCGAWAKAPGEQCPLNVCCSQWGNCGYTADFCEGKCQSNCGQPSQTTESGSDPQQLVIGYFESWTVGGDGCRTRSIQSLPIDSLTHINVGFGYIKPGSFEVYPMDTSEEVYREIANLKRRAPGLKIWISLGGWTFNDPGPTQNVFSDLASSADKRMKFIENLAKFMRSCGFDGVDIDWEYPGAPDRGGREDDGDNYVALLASMREYFDAQPEDWGISFAAPTSYWYLRWFKIEAMMNYANWVNLMTYDLHGSWDNSTSYIGPYVFAHTNLTEIDIALNLLWRNNVEGSQVNMGIGFYGRTFTLKNARSWKPGAEQIGPGREGPCTQTKGYLSYAEIVGVVDEYNLDTVHDEESGIKYVAWGKDQWVAFDDKETLKQKVEFASKRGLGGLMIWAVDLDTPKWDALDALLQPDGLGKFRDQNGVHEMEGFDKWSRQGAQCYLGECSEKPTCGKTGFVKTDHGVPCNDAKEWRNICCDFEDTPDPKTCKWRGGGRYALACAGDCKDDEILVLENDWYYEEENGGDGRGYCFGGKAKYCCEAEDVENPCLANTKQCIRINDKNEPATDNDRNDACPEDYKFITYAQANCKEGYGMPFCCREEVDSNACYWKKGRQAGSKGMSAISCSDSEKCGTGEVSLGSWYRGEGSQCQDTFEANPDSIRRPHFPKNAEYDKALCCNANALSIHTKNLPVKLEYLFPHPGPESNKENYTLVVNTELRGEDESQDINSNAFAWIVMSGEEKDLVLLDKRDGSHWELFDCDAERHEGRQRARAICTTTGPHSTCGSMFTGAVAGTVIELPDHCGARDGRYAVAVSFEPSEDQSLPDEVAWHFAGTKRSAPPEVYDLVFDYDFKSVRKRDDSSLLVRIDYSDDPGYWSSIVDGSGERKKRDLELMQEEVDRNHGGSWPGYLHHRWRKERRETPLHKRDELHRRWFSATLKSWIDKMLKVDKTSTLGRHVIEDEYKLVLFDETMDCPGPKAHFEIYADIKVKADVTAQLSLIGNLADMSSWEESHVLFRSSGNVRARLVFDASAELTFNLGQREVFGAQNFGATFYVPGIVTIGPNFRLLAKLSGQAQLTLKSWVDYNIAEWDYVQQYPNKGGDNSIDGGLTENEKGKMAFAADPPNIGYDASAYGQIKGTVTARLEFGVVFNWDNSPNIAVALAAEAEVKLYGSANAGTGKAPQACYGMRGLCRLYALVDAPKVFGVNLDTTKNLLSADFEPIPQKCIGG